MKACKVNGGISPSILDLGTEWRWVVCITPRLLYPWGKSLWYPLNKEAGWAPEAVQVFWRNESLFFPCRDLNSGLSSLWPSRYAHYIKMRNVYQIQLGNPNGRHHLADLDLDGSIMLKYSCMLLVSSDLKIGCNFNPASVFHQNFLVIT